MPDTQHSTLTGDDLHEPKGVATAAAGKAYVADGAGSGTWTTVSNIEHGWWDNNDLTTATTPIALTVANTQYEMTNDGAGSFTNLTYGIDGTANIWNTSTNRFDFTGLNLGDTVDVRFDVEYVTTSANTAISLDIELGVGASPYQIALVSEDNKKTAGTYKVVVQMSFYMGDANTRNNPARVLASADTTGTTVKVNGWFARAIKVHSE